MPAFFLAPAASGTTTFPTDLGLASWVAFWLPNQETGHTAGPISRQPILKLYRGRQSRIRESRESCCRPALCPVSSDDFLAIHPSQGSTLRDTLVNIYIHLRRVLPSFISHLFPFLVPPSAGDRWDLGVSTTGVHPRSNIFAKSLPPSIQKQHTHMHTH